MDTILKDIVGGTLDDLKDKRSIPQQVILHASWQTVPKDSTIFYGCCQHNPGIPSQQIPGIFQIQARLACGLVDDLVIDPESMGRIRLAFLRNGFRNE
jgi:hypothetical protein